MNVAVPTSLKSTRVRILQAVKLFGRAGIQAPTARNLAEQYKKLSTGTAPGTQESAEIAGTENGINGAENNDTETQSDDNGTENANTGTNNDTDKEIANTTTHEATTTAQKLPTPAQQSDSIGT